MPIQAPKSKQLRFAMTAMFLLVLFGVFSVFASWTVDAATSRFGSASWWYLLPAFLVIAAGLIVAGATTVTFRDHNAMRKYRLGPNHTLNDGQQVAVSGRIRIKGVPLRSPYSRQPCAGYRYEVSGQRREIGSDNHNRTQLCLAGYALATAYLDAETRRFRINAIAYADDELRSIKTGGDWGQRAFDDIRSRAETLPATPEIEVRATLASAQERVEPPTAADFIVRQTIGASNTISVTEDILPIDREVTLLATYSAETNSLEGKRLGGMKAFQENLDQQLEIQQKDIRQGLLVTLVLLGVGIPLISLAWWLP